LERCRGLPTVSATYLEGLIHFYNRRYAQALEQAAQARKTTPWLYEAAKLEGDVYLARALDAKDRGDNENAERDFDQAVEYYGQAADIGRSDHQVYEALAEAWIRQEELDLYRGRDPKVKLEKALAAADKSLIAAPKESSGHTKKAFAYYFQAQYAQGHGAAREEVERHFQGQIDNGKLAIATNPKDAYAQEITGLGYTRLAEYRIELGEAVEPFLLLAIASLQEALRLKPAFPWAYNDYGYALGLQGYAKKRRNEDPTVLFRNAVEATKKAIEIDNQYFMAYNNASVWLYELAGWQVDHGGNPDPAIEQAVQMADRAIQINNRHPLAHGNSGLVWLLAVTYRRDLGLDARKQAQLAVERFTALLEIDPRVVAAFRDLARSKMLLISQERAHGAADPASLSLVEVTQVLEKCYRVEVNNPECQVVEAELNVERANWAKQRQEPFSDFLKRARQLAEEATKKLPNRGDLAYILAEVCLEEARLLPNDASKESRKAINDAGFRSIKKTLDLAPGLPRALALEGELYFHKAKIEDDSGTTWLEQAKSDFSKAFAENPNLKRRYGVVSAEVERLLKSD
jgi:eukaryotic-like serine/threonine-protein kinase